MIKFVKGAPALRFDDWLVITDLHLGLERDYWMKGYDIPPQKDSILKRIMKIKKDSRNLMILGDIKHNIPNTTRRELSDVSELISKLKSVFKEVVIIKGNHDGNIERITPAVKEYFIGNVAFIHGHSVSKKVLESERIIAGHMHPVYAYKNHLGIIQRKKCFVITPKIIILPAFTELSAGSHELAKPLKKYVLNEERLLLDLTKVK